MKSLAVAIVVVSVMNVRASADPDPFATPNAVPSSRGVVPEPKPDTKIESLTTCVEVDRGKPRRRMAKWIAGAGGALELASFGLGMYEQGRYKDATRNLYVNENAVAIANDARNITRYYVTGVFLAGTAALGVAAYLYFTAPPKEALTRTVVVPSVAPDQLGFAIAGGF
jgi:hypothetical protein